MYQWNPTGCEHKNKQWGLVKTRDFMHYTKHSLVLKPDQLIDKDGCYAGTAVMPSFKCIWTQVYWKFLSMIVRL